MSSRLLVDGYNLLHASNVFASPAGPPTLERTRAAFLQFLADSLEDRQRKRTTIVFDATQAPPGLPQELHFAGMKVLFSRHGQDADQLIEDLLEAERAPREMLVVSSDHRVQRAARQHGAKHVDSEIWFRELEASRRQMELVARDAKPDAQAMWESSAELQAWLKEFGDIDSSKLAPLEDLQAKPPAIEPAVPKSTPTKKQKPHRPPLHDDKPSIGGNPFPPGYGEDLLE